MCSIFSRLINGHSIVGRNFDWIQLGGNIHFMRPTRQYGLTTYGLCVIEQLGRDRPFEGLNSQGLFMGMAGIHADDFPARKPLDAAIKLDEFGVIRFVLERAATTRQAWAILDQVQIVPHGIEPYIRLQYLIADRQGDVCIIAGPEKTAIQRLDATTFAAATNFPLSLRGQIVCDRFELLAQRLPTVTNEPAAIALIEAVSQPSTVYSCLYSLTQKTVSLWIERDFQTPLRFNLDQELAQGSSFYNFGQLKLLSAEGQDRFKEAPYNVQCGFA
ncbi:linear amide C-N hydrolase [Nodosilinea sp. LEGE 07088]|uniref:linear amide C-N hydrolase n=1 Tax=Nodosilinea sp. LEGE 07088 TaxID=2777968 RepID=UPI00187E01B7|nr:linear amide C-N hydrolase [Nodosilinea sp. LEGE 07088]MBE9137073.1 linear amide C-N hydrolase [Nodosilinea sp. LEGE 07088]